MEQAVGKIEQLPLTAVGGVVKHIGAVVLAQAGAEADHEAVEPALAELVAVHEAVAALGVVDRLFAGLLHNDGAGRGRDEAELVLGDGEAGLVGADAGGAQAERLRIENLAGLGVEGREILAAGVAQHRERERDLRRSGIARIGWNEQRHDGGTGGGADADDGLTTDGCGVELVVVELREDHVGALAAVGRGEVNAHFPASERPRAERDVVAVRGLVEDVVAAAVAAVDAVGVDVVLQAAEAADKILRLGNVVIYVAGDAALPEVELEADIAALAFADREKLVVDIAAGVEIDLRVGGIVARDAQAADGRVEDEAGREAVVGNRSALHARVDANRARFLGAVAGHGVDAAAPPLAEEAEALAGLAGVVEGAARSGDAGGVDRAGKPHRIPRRARHGVRVERRSVAVGLAVGMSKTGEGPLAAADDLRGKRGHPHGWHFDTAGGGVGDVGEILNEGAVGIGLEETPRLRVHPRVHVLIKCARLVAAKPLAEVLLIGEGGAEAAGTGPEG